MLALLICLLALLGLAVGSFLNVVIYRVPLRRSIAHPPSACPHCGHGIAWYDNIPVVSWLALRAKCRNCGAPISARYPLVELGTGLSFVAVGLVFLPDVVGSSTLAPLLAALLALVAFLCLAAISIALAMIDLDTQTLPNRLVFPSYIVGAILLGGSAVLSGSYGALIVAAIGCAASFALYFLMALVYPGGMGFGDVKLAGVLGLFLGWLGWGELAVGSFAPFALGGLFAIALLIIKRAGRKSRIPFGPWMLIGAWVGIFVGRDLSGWYLGLFGLA